MRKRYWKKRSVQCISCMLMMMVFLGCNNSSKVKTIKLGHGLDVTHPVHKAMVFMAEQVAKKSGGKLQIDIYPSQQLGTERECLELLQIGTLGMTKVSTGVLENFAPGMKIFGVPFLFKDREHFYNVLDDSIGQQLLKGPEKFWLKGLAYYDAGSRSFYTINSPVKTPEDLEGLKIRVMESVTSMEMVRSLGGAPTPVAWGELYTALQQGIVDGAENNPPSFYLSHHYEVCKYYILDEHTYLPDVLLISTIIWDKLDEQEQKWITEAANESVRFQRKIWQEAEEEALKAVKAHGVEVIYPDKNLFAAEVKDLHAQFKKDPRMNTLINSIERLQ